MIRFRREIINLSSRHTQCLRCYPSHILYCAPVLRYQLRRTQRNLTCADLSLLIPRFPHRLGSTQPRSQSSSLCFDLLFSSCRNATFAKTAALNSAFAQKGQGLTSFLSSPYRECYQLSSRQNRAQEQHRLSTDCVFHTLTPPSPKETRYPTLT